MKNKPIQDLVREAMAAAEQARSIAVALRTSPDPQIIGVYGAINQLQGVFESVKPLLRYDAAALDAAAAEMWPGRGLNVLAEISKAQAAGQAFREGVATLLIDPTKPATAHDSSTGTIRYMSVSAEDRAALAPLLDALIASLDFAA